ncbi:MAG: CDP-alcohol phosphatidyltransferase family protein [Acidimicrobiales bacterium]
MTEAADRPIAGGDESRILTVPNVITLVRLACLPLYLVILLGRDQRFEAALLLGALGATVWVDGYIARRFHQVSTLGKVLDPVVDRLLFFVGIAGILLVDPPGAPVWFCWMVIVRELFVSGATLGLAAMGARRIDVTWFGKAGTFGLMFAFPLFLAGSSTRSSAPIFQALGWMTGVPGLVLSYYAAVLYVPIGLRALREGRAERSSPAPG